MCEEVVLSCVVNSVHGVISSLFVLYDFVIDNDKIMDNGMDNESLHEYSHSIFDLWSLVCC